jgi:hypothetical protein
MSPGTSPFARTNAMIGSMSGENSPTAMAGRKGSQPGVRLLARGQIFEASRRVEVSSDSSLYTNGQGLIKLADGSGWAIVPYQQDLMAQLKSLHANDAALFENAKDIAAYEEIGNAVIPTARTVGQPSLPKQRDRNSSDWSMEDIIWLRVANPPNGIKVLLPLTQHRSNSNQQINEKESRVKALKDSGGRDEPPSTSHDSDVASSAVGSSFFESVWSRVSPVKEKEKTLHFQHGSSSQNLRQQQQPQRQQTVPVIPCGMVVPVEPWDVSTSPKVRVFFPCDFSVLLCILNHIFCYPSEAFCSSV